MQSNPYAPPADAHAPTAMGGEPVWRENDAACMWKVAPFFPARCVVCNDHAKHRIRKTVYWHESWVYITILAGVLIYALAAMILRKSTHVDYGLCDKHKLRRTLGFLTIFGGFVAGLGLILGSAMFMMGGDIGVVILVGVAIMVFWTIAGVLMSRTLRPTRIDDHRAWFKTGPRFLDSLSHHPMPPPHAGLPAAPGYQASWGPR